MDVEAEMVTKISQIHIGLMSGLCIRGCSAMYPT